MSAQGLGICADCGQEYREPEVVIGPPSEITLRPITREELTAQLHREADCPVQREREPVEGLTAALRYFGVADLMTKVGEIMRADEHNSEYIWGDAERWFEREREQGEEQKRSGGIGTPPDEQSRVLPRDESA